MRVGSDGLPDEELLVPLAELAQLAPVRRAREQPRLHELVPLRVAKDRAVFQFDRQRVRGLFVFSAHVGPDTDLLTQRTQGRSVVQKHKGMSRGGSRVLLSVPRTLQTELRTGVRRGRMRQTQDPSSVSRTFSSLSPKTREPQPCCRVRSRAQRLHLPLLLPLLFHTSVRPVVCSCAGQRGTVFWKGQGRGWRSRRSLQHQHAGVGHSLCWIMRWQERTRSQPRCLPWKPRPEAWQT